MVPQTDVTDLPDTAVRSHILTQVYPCPQGGVIDQPAVGPGAVPYVPLYTGPSDEDLTHFPREIAGMRQWSLWRLMPDPDRPGKWKKPPFDAYHLGPLAGGRTNERHLLASLEHCVTVLPLARARWRTDPAGFYGAGIGFHLFKDQGIFFLDLD